MTIDKMSKFNKFVIPKIKKENKLNLQLSPIETTPLLLDKIEPTKNNPNQWLRTNVKSLIAPIEPNLLDELEIDLENNFYQSPRTLLSPIEPNQLDKLKIDRVENKFNQWPRTKVTPFKSDTIDKTLPRRHPTNSGYRRTRGKNSVNKMYNVWRGGRNQHKRTKVVCSAVNPNLPTHQSQHKFLSPLPPPPRPVTQRQNKENYKKNESIFTANICSKTPARSMPVAPGALELCRYIVREIEAHDVKRDPMFLSFVDTSFEKYIETPCSSYSTFRSYKTMFFHLMSRRKHASHCTLLLNTGIFALENPKTGTVVQCNTYLPVWTQYYSAGQNFYKDPCRKTRSTNLKCFVEHIVVQKEHEPMCSLECQIGGMRLSFPGGMVDYG